jgi:uncharacterized protein (DUF1778 family)
MRLPEVDLAVIDRAARLLGRSRTDFVRAAAVRAAEDVLMEQSAVRRTPDQFDAFNAAVAGPGEAQLELVELLLRPPPWGGAEGGR